jgi:hypothetical protein
MLCIPGIPEEKHVNRFDYCAVGSMDQYSWFITTDLELDSTAGGD